MIWLAWIGCFILTCLILVTLVELFKPILIVTLIYTIVGFLIWSVITVVKTYADDGTYFKFGLGIDNTLGNTKIIAGGYQGNLIGFFDYQLEGGIFNDNDQPQGSVVFAGSSVGLSVHTRSGLYTKLFVGPSLISQTDSRLSSILEFNDDFELGLEDNRGISIGLNAKHMSNAGFWPPNIGRDFLMLKFQIPF